jgi:hypothetical protein
MRTTSRGLKPAPAASMAARTLPPQRLRRTRRRRRLRARRPNGEDLGRASAAWALRGPWLSRVPTPGRSATAAAWSRRELPAARRAARTRDPRSVRAACCRRAVTSAVAIVAAEAEAEVASRAVREAEEDAGSKDAVKAAGRGASEEAAGHSRAHRLRVVCLPSGRSRPCVPGARPSHCRLPWVATEQAARRARAARAACENPPRCGCRTGCAHACSSGRRSRRRT